MRLYTRLLFASSEIDVLFGCGMLSDTEPCIIGGQMVL